MENVLIAPIVLLLLGGASSAGRADVVFQNGVATPNDPTAWTISSDAAVSDSFQFSASTKLTSIDFDYWATAECTSVDWTISSQPDDGGTVYGSATASLTAGNTTFEFLNSPSNYNVYQASFSVGTLTLPAATYYLTLQGAGSSNDINWDQPTDGTSLAFFNWPSRDYSSNYAVPSEVFRLNGALATPELTAQHDAAALVFLVGTLCVVRQRSRKRTGSPRSAQCEASSFPAHSWP